jgi:hypothetical protein
MAQFDIIAASAASYKTCWQNRRYLAKLAFAPFLIKTCCLVFAASFAGEGDTTTFLFYMLPALFAEGWMLAHFTRFIVLGQTWPFRPTGDRDADMGVLRIRARGILSGMAAYVLINMTLGLLTVLAQHYFGPYISRDTLETGAEIPAPVAVVSLFMLGAMFWGFRLLWLYIPVALNSSPGYCLFRLRGLGTSVHMIGAWVICILPFLLGMQILAAVVAVPVGALLGKAAGYFAVTIVAAAVDTVKSLVVTGGMTFGIRDIYTREKA